MFCSTCGTQLDSSAKFCSGCGASVSGKQASTPPQDTQNPLVRVKPVFIPWVTIASVIPIQLFFTVWAGGFFGGFATVGSKFIGLDFPVWLPFVVCGGLAFFGIPFLVYTAKKKTYANTEYKFYSDRLEYAEGFWTAERKSIKYQNIIEANLRKGVVQKSYGLGSILLSTPATGAQQGRSRSGIVIRDIENAEALYEKVKELIN